MKSNTICRIQSASTAIIVALPLLFLLISFTFIFTLWSGRSIITAGYTRGNADNISMLVNQSFIYLFILAVLIVCFLLFKKIRKENTPFLPVVSKYIKIIGALIMFTAPLSRWISHIIVFPFTEELTLLGQNDILGITIGGIFACLAIIFEYGCILQTQDDETL